MSSRERREELRREREAEAIRAEAEQNRRANRTWYEKIEECNDVHSIKEVLHELVESLDL